MKLFSGIRKRQSVIKYGMKPIDAGILDRVVKYVEHLSLPEASGTVQVQLLEELEKGTGSVPYYLLFYTDGTEAGYLNAGYAAGMAAYFLRFQGIRASVLRESPIRLNKTEYTGMRCTGAIAFGNELKEKSVYSRSVSEPELPCILKEQREHWIEEVLGFAKEHFSAGMGAVQIIRQDDWIHFVKKPAGRRNSYASMFEAGAAIAGIMAAAEELWLDLAMMDVQEILEETEQIQAVKLEKHSVKNSFTGNRAAQENPFLSQDYVISICRRKECRNAVLQLLRKYSVQSETGSEISKRNLWKYA